MPWGNPPPVLTPRRVFVPQSLWITDATETHIRGVQWDSFGQDPISSDGDWSRRRASQ